MPQGKGTYGSKVGRPKKKYDKGGNVDPFSTRNPEGVPAEQAMDMLEDANMAREGLPTSNAQDRSQVSPDTEQYKEGGKVKERTWDITDVVGEAGAGDPFKDDPAKKGKWKKKYVSDLAKKALKGEKRRVLSASESPLAGRPKRYETKPKRKKK